MKKLLVKIFLLCFFIFIIFLAFKKLKKEKIKVGTFVTIGTGPAIDAIGAAEIFSPELVVLTDINPNVIDIAYRNFLNYSLRKKIKSSEDSDFIKTVPCVGYIFENNY